MTDRFVAPGGANTGAGGTGAPWLTLSYALSTASATVAGDTIYMRTGTYNERVVCQVSGTAGNPITVEADAGHSPVLAGASGQTGIIVITNGIEYVTLGDGITYSYGHAQPGTPRFTWISVTGADTNHIIIQNCTLERTGYSTDLATLAASPWQEFGITISDATDCLVDGVTIRGVCKGVALNEQCMRATVKDCDIGYCVQSGIVIGSSGGVIRGIVIVGNKLHHSAKEDGLQFIPTNGLTEAQKQVDDSNRGTLILGNEIAFNGEGGFDMKATRYVVIEGNILHGMAGSNDGFDASVGQNTGSPGVINAGANTYSTAPVIVRNNIIYDDQSGPACRIGWKLYHNDFLHLRRTYAGTPQAAAKSTGISQARSSNPVLGIRNNIFAGNKYDIELMAGQNQPGNEVDIDFNLYASGAWTDSTSGNDYLTLAAWKARLGANNWRYGKDANSLYMGGATQAARHAAIKLINVSATPTGEPADYDFGLQADSPAKGAGGWLTRTVGAGSGTAVVVEDANWFATNFGRDDYQPADRIFFGGQERTITAINYGTNTLTLNATATWGNLTPVYYVLPGEVASATPDMGALNFVGATTPPPPPPPPTPGGPGGRASVRGALNTVTGNQTFTFATPLTGTPIAWRFTVTEATADDTAADGAVIGRGWAWNNAGTIVQGAWSTRSRHGNTGSATSGRTITDGCVLLGNPASTSVDGQAAFVSGDASSVTINITDAFSAGFLVTITAFVATAAYFGTFAIQQTQDAYTTVTPGFQPNYIEVFTNNRAIPSAPGGVRTSHGFATYAASTITQQCMYIGERTTSTPSEVVAHLRNDYVGIEATDGAAALTNGLQISNMGSTDFRVNTKAGTHTQADAAAFVFCLLFDQDVYSGIITTPTAVDAAKDYAIGFAPASADVIASTLTATNTADATGLAGAYAIGMWDGTLQFSNSIADQDAANPTNTQSRVDDRFVNLDKHDGSAGHIAAVVGAQTTNLRVNHSTVTGAANKWILVAVGESFVPTVTADFSGTPLSGIRPVTTVFTNTSTADGTTITTYAWDFGDGSTSTSASPSHTYTAAGSYTVTLTESDGTVSNTLVRSEYVVISDPLPVELIPSSLVLASGDPVGLQPFNNVVVSGGMISVTENRIWWKGHSDAVSGTSYKIYSDVATPNVFTSVLATQAAQSPYAPPTSTLVNAIDANDISLELSVTTNFADDDYAKIERESILLDGKTGSVYAALTRGAHNTIRQSHPAGITVFRMHETYLHTGITWGSRHVIRYRVRVIITAGGPELVAAEAVVVNPTLPATNDKIVIWGIQDDAKGEPAAGLNVSMTLNTAKSFGPGTMETLDVKPQTAITDASGYWELVAQRDVARVGGGQFILTIDGVQYPIIELPDQDTICYLECV